MRVPRITCLLVLGVLIAVATPTAKAGPITLVAAPSAGGSYYGMYCVSCVGASFTLASSADVTTISMTLYTPAASNFPTFDFSLMSSATTTLASEALTAPLGSVSTEVMNVNEIFPAGTYYLVGNVPGYAGTTVTPGNVDGWLLSTGVYDNAAGTVANGLGSFVGNTWTVNSSPGYYAPAFLVSGIAATILSGFNGGSSSAPVFLTAPLVGEVTGTIGGLGSEDYYSFLWGGVPLAPPPA